MVTDEDSAVKEVEVTAKQIVDRISVQMSSNASANAGLNPGVMEEKLLKIMSNERRADAKSMQTKRVSLSSTYGVDQDGISDMNSGLLRMSLSEEGTVQENTMQGQRSSIGSTQGSFLQDSVPASVTEHEKKAEVLLNAVTKWLAEIGNEHETEAKDILGADALVPENFHWIFSIESYIRSLSRTSQKALTSKIVGLLVNWHKQLFHFAKPKRKEDPEYNRVLSHWDPSLGLVAIVKLILGLKFPQYAVKGFETFAEEGKYPILFCCDEDLARSLAAKLGLPTSYFDILKTEVPEWTTAFEKRIQEAISNNRVPIACIFNINGKNIDEACGIAESNNLWMHLWGENLLPYLVEKTNDNEIGSSLTLDITRWMQNPKLPHLTFYKHAGTLEPGVSESCDAFSEYCDISTFAPWLITSVVGQDELRNLVKEVTTRGRFLLNMMRKYECLQIVPDWCEISSGTEIVTSITFQYNPPDFSRNDAIPTSETHSEVNTDKPSAQYVDTLNSWLYHIMDRDLKDFIPVEFVLSSPRGWNVSIDVLRCPKFEADDEEVITSLFDNHLSVLQSTVAQKKVFCKLVEESHELEWVDHESQWAGIGAVRYIPAFHRQIKLNGELTGSSANLTEETVKGNIDRLNAQIVDKLKSIDSAFSLGESSNGEWCVQFGMVTMETDVKELVRLVVAAGQEIEESSEFLSRMSELVKQGIERAEEELRKESEEALWEEGILRKVPVVGTFVNWLSPPAKEIGVRGRALNLTQGKVESTENIYKYHMQVESPAASHQ